MEMMPAAIAAQMAITQQRATMSMMKQTAQMQQQIVDVLSASTNALRGGNIDIAA